MSVSGTVLYKLWLAAFPGSVASMTSLTPKCLKPCRTSALSRYRICLVPPPTCTYRGKPTPGSPSLLRPTSPLIKSPGILTWFPSTTLFSLALGPTHPAPINVVQETWDFRRAGFSPALSLLMSAFALLIPPAHFSMHLLQPTERSPTTFAYANIRSFGDWF